MDQVHVIRHKVVREGRSIRGVAREMGFSRNTVRKYLRVSEPVRRERKRRARPVRDKVGPRIEELLEEWSGRTTAKQRVTATRVYRQLVEEGYQVGITTVRRWLAERRREGSEVFIPLLWRPGDGAQVDFFEVTVRVGGEWCKVWKFLLRLMYSGRDFVWLYERADQVSFLEGHVRAFEHLEGVPARLIYDNLSLAVRRRVGAERLLTDRFRALVSHYLFEPCFARSGEGHDKGGVEGRGKGIRLEHLTPIPQGESLEAISRELLAAVDQSASRRKDRAGRTVSERFETERGRLGPLPEHRFEVRSLEFKKVNRKCLVRVEGADYSVPSHWKQLEVEVWAGVREIRFCCRGEEVVVERVAKGTRRVAYRHYLEELARKPQAVRQVAPELTAELGPPYQRLWKVLCETHGARKGARLLAGLLGAIVKLGEAVVRPAVEEALSAGRADLLTLAGRLRPVGPTPLRVPEQLRQYRVEGVRASDYDWMLSGGER